MKFVFFLSFQAQESSANENAQSMLNLQDALKDLKHNYQQQVQIRFNPQTYYIVCGPKAFLGKSLGWLGKTEVIKY